jgi:hypothetical protein
MKNLWSIFVLLLTGCSAIPLASREENQVAKEFHTLPNGSAIYIFRDQVLVGSAIAATLFVDGKLIGGINDHDFRRLEVAPGQHQLTATSNTGVVASLHIEAKAGDIYFVRATSWPRLMLVTSDEGKKQVRKCKLEKAN